MAVHVHIHRRGRRVADAEPNRTIYKVVTQGAPNEVWASGFYGDYGKEKAERWVREGYWHRHMYPKDKHKTLIVVPEKG